MTATVCAKIAGVNCNTVISYYQRDTGADIRGGLREAGKEFGEFECDGSYFGARRIRSKRGEKVYVRVVENRSRESLMPIIQGSVLSGSTTYTDC